MKVKKRSFCCSDRVVAHSNDCVSYTDGIGLKRLLDEDDDDHRVQKHWKPNATVHKEYRRYVYYSDQTENNRPLVDLITSGGFLRLHGPRASGKSSRMVDAMTELRKKGFKCIEYVVL